MTNKEIFKAVARAVYVTPFGNQYQVIYPFYDGQLDGPTGSSNSTGYWFSKQNCRRIRIFEACLALLEKRGLQPDDDIYYQLECVDGCGDTDWRSVAVGLANSVPSVPIQGS